MVVETQAALTLAYETLMRISTRLKRKCSERTLENRLELIQGSEAHEVKSDANTSQ